MALQTVARQEQAAVLDCLPLHRLGPRSRLSPPPPYRASRNSSLRRRSAGLRTPSPLPTARQRSRGRFTGTRTPRQMAVRSPSASAADSTAKMDSSDWGNMGFGPADGASLTAQEANRLAPLFFPPDAKYQHDIHDPDGGTIHVYRSADLAASFPASDFRDSNSGAADPPGTFAVACDQPNVSPGCSLVVGT